jgi:glycine cleavage system regulatory protein
VVRRACRADVLISLVVTVIGPDRPGLVSLLSDRGKAAGANWAESRMASLAGQFAGIVRFTVPEENAAALAAGLGELAATGLNVVIAESAGEPAHPDSRLLELELVGQDRPGIVRDISKVLADNGISIEELHTEVVSGAWSAEQLFEVKALLLVPRSIATDELRRMLETLANELMVDITLDENVGVPR